jgi:hypothetical protein
MTDFTPFIDGSDTSCAAALAILPVAKTLKGDPA